MKSHAKQVCPVAARVWERGKSREQKGAFSQKTQKSPFVPIVILIPFFIMQNLPLVKGFCTFSGEISVLHNPGFRATK